MKDWGTLRMIGLLLLLVAISMVAFWFFQQQLYFSMFFSLMLIIVIMSYLVHNHTLATRSVLRMIQSLRYGDFSLSFSAKHHSQLEKELLEDINQVIAQFRSQLSEKEEKYKYFETLLDTVDTCLLVADKEGNVWWMNKAGVQDLCGYAILRLEDLKTLNQDFPVILKSLQPGEVKVVRIYKEEVMQDMAVTVTEYTTSNTALRLVSLKNIRSILEENEMEAWQKLVRVLTHEIMNSITPIISLSETLCERALQQGMEEGSLMLQGMETIHRRSKGLLGFVENYRKLSRLSSPMLAPVSVGELLRDMQKLFASSDVTYVYKVENEARELMIDRSQMEQVLINLLKNAGEACADQPNPNVLVETFFDADKHIFRLSVTDNGCGILPSVVDKIFIPFFTTKSSGSGIGLSLCKQILTLHGGSIRVSSEVGKGSCFTLKLMVK